MVRRTLRRIIMKHQKKMSRRTIGVNLVFDIRDILFYPNIMGVCRNSFLVFVSDGINLDLLKI